MYRPLGRGADGSSSDGRVALAADVVVAGGPGAIPLVVVVVVDFPRRQLVRSRALVLLDLLVEAVLLQVALVLILAAAVKDVSGGHARAIAATLLCNPLWVGSIPPRRHLAGLHRAAAAAAKGVALPLLGRRLRTEIDGQGEIYDNGNTRLRVTCVRACVERATKKERTPVDTIWGRGGDVFMRA